MVSQNNSHIIMNVDRPQKSEENGYSFCFYETYYQVYTNCSDDNIISTVLQVQFLHNFDACTLSIHT